MKGKIKEMSEIYNYEENSDQKHNFNFPQESFQS